MNLVSSLVRLENTFAEADVASKKRLFELAGKALQSSHGVSANEVFDSLLAREKLGSTALGYGIAIPHGRIKGLKDAACCFVRLKTPVDFGAPDNLPVDLAFILMAPETATDLHLQILAELAQMFSDRSMRENLRRAPDATTLHRLICEWTP